MRAGRLVQLLRLLQSRGQMTAGELAAELEVTSRTVLRDIEALSGAGVPVYARRGPRGGFALLADPVADLPVAEGWATEEGLSRSGPRAVVLLSPAGRRTAMLLGRPDGLRIRRSRGAVRERGEQIEASFPLRSIAAAVHDLVAIGAEVEVVRPPELRAALADVGRAIAARNH